MKRVKRIVSILICAAMLLPCAVIPAAAATVAQLKTLISSAEEVLYSDGTLASRRQLKAAYDTASSIAYADSPLSVDVTAAYDMLSAAIDGFVAVESPVRADIGGFAVWDAETVSAFTDTSGCAVFYDGGELPAVKVVTAGKTTAFFSNAVSDEAVSGASVFSGVTADTAGLRFRTEFRDLSLVDTVSVSVGVRSAEGRRTYTAAGIPAQNGYVAIDWEFFTADYDAVGSGLAPDSLNYIAFSFEGVKPGFIAEISDLHCFSESVLSSAPVEYSEVRATAVYATSYYKIVDSSTGLALTASPATTDTQRMTNTGYENRIVNKQTGITVSMQERRDGDPCQEWQLYRLSDGVFRIINRDNSLALSASYNVLNYKIDVDVINLNDTKQDWRVSRSSNGFKIAYSGASSMYLNYTTNTLKASSVQQVWDVYECVRGDWNQVWNDEFDGDAVDRSKWMVYNGHVRNDGKDEPIVFLDNGYNVTVSDGNLLIRTRREEYNGLHFSGGYLTTEGRFYMSYGKVEMRAKLPTGNWIWPALWMMGINGTWPQNGEIDIMELVGGGKEDSKLYGTLHWTPDFDMNNSHFVKGVEIYNKNDVSLGDAYHTYGLEWENDQLRIYFDGMQYVSLNLTTDGMRWGYGDDPHYLILNTSIRGKGNREAYDDTAEESEYLIDYIRVSKRASDTSASAETANAGLVEGTRIGSGIGNKGASKVVASPDGNYFSIIDREGRIFQHDAKTGAKLYSEETQAGPLYALKYSPSGKYLAAGSRQSGIVIYKSSDLTNRAFASAPGVYFEALEFSPDDSRLFAGGRNDHVAEMAGDNKYLFAFGSMTGSLQGKTYLGSDVRAISVSDDGALVAAGTSSGAVYILDAVTLEILRSVDMGATVRGVKFLPNGALFAASDEEGDILVFDATSGDVVMTVANPDGASVSGIDVSPDGSRLVASSSDNNARVFDLGSGKLIALLDGFSQMTTSAKFSLDGNRISVCSTDGNARIYDKNGGLLYSFNVTAGYKKGTSLADIAVSADGTAVLAAPIQENDVVYYWKTLPMADKTPLYKAIYAAQDIDASRFTAESVEVLRETMEASNSLLRSSAATPDQISDCIRAINNAKNHLVMLPGAETNLNGFEGWTASDLSGMTTSSCSISLSSSSISITPNVTQSLCVTAGSTKAWEMYNISPAGGVSGKNPFGADMSNCDGISFWAKGLTKEQSNGKVFIGYTGETGSFLFSAKLPVITTSGAYIQVPFSDFTHVSGEETLDLTKLNTIGFYGKSAKGMFVFTELTAYTEPGETPVVTGVEDGATYDITDSAAPSATWDSGVAFLDGESYIAGTPIAEAGTHRLSVNNHGTELDIDFTVVDNTPIPVISGVAERQVFDIAAGESALPTWDVGDALLNGEEYSGAEINKVGEYTLTVTNRYKTSSVFFIVIDTSESQTQILRGDLDGDGQITVSDALAALRIAAKLAEETPEAVEIGDADGDGRITVSDALAILRVAAKLADSL